MNRLEQQMTSTAVQIVLSAAESSFWQRYFTRIASFEASVDQACSRYN